MPAAITKLFPFLTCQNINNEYVIVVNPAHLLIVTKILQNHFALQFKILSCISGVDFLGSKHRFCVVYDFLSVRFAARLRVKIFANNAPQVPSICSVFTNANWWEREAWDMYGIFFKSHPDLRRILTDYGFEGYPQRKDFPLSGYTELRYDAFKKKIVAEPLELSQAFRTFHIESQW